MRVSVREMDCNLRLVAGRFAELAFFGVAPLAHWRMNLIALWRKYIVIASHSRREFFLFLSDGQIDRSLVSVLYFRTDGRGIAEETPVVIGSDFGRQAQINAIRAGVLEVPESDGSIRSVTVLVCACDDGFVRVVDRLPSSRSDVAPVGSAADDADRRASDGDRSVNDGDNDGDTELCEDILLDQQPQADNVTVLPEFLTVCVHADDADDPSAWSIALSGHTILVGSNAHVVTRLEFAWDKGLRHVRSQVAYRHRHNVPSVDMLNETSASVSIAGTWQWGRLHGSTVTESSESDQDEADSEPSGDLAPTQHWGWSVRVLPQQRLLFTTQRKVHVLYSGNNEEIQRLTVGVESRTWSTQLRPLHRLLFCESVTLSGANNRPVTLAFVAGSASSQVTVLHVPEHFTSESANDPVNRDTDTVSRHSPIGTHRFCQIALVPQSARDANDDDDSFVDPIRGMCLTRALRSNEAVLHVLFATGRLVVATVCLH
ncbi:MAG: hypothetical protein MHM6MM_006115 [Cercozoa sp. M6MM]